MQSLTMYFQYEFVEPTWTNTDDGIVGSGGVQLRLKTSFACIIRNGNIPAMFNSFVRAATAISTPPHFNLEYILQTEKYRRICICLPNNLKRSFTVHNVASLAPAKKGSELTKSLLDWLR